MSDMVKHVIVGDMLGTLSAYFDNPVLNNSVCAFGAGFLSHAALDYIENDYVVNWFNQSEFLEALPFVIFQVVATAILLYIFIYNNKKYSSKYTNLRIIAVIGAISPDLIDGIYSVINPAAWYSGQLIFPWHSLDVGSENFTMSMYATMLITIIFIISRYFFYKYIFTKELIYPEVIGFHLTKTPVEKNNPE